MATSGSEEKPAVQPAPGSFSELLRTWRYLFWLLGLAVLVGLFYLEENWRGDRAWARYRQEMAAKGVRLDFAAFVPPPVPPSDNFANTPFLAPVFQNRGIRGFAPRYDAAERVMKRPKASGSNSWVRSRLDLALWQAQLEATSTNGSGSPKLLP